MKLYFDSEINAYTLELGTQCFNQKCKCYSICKKAKKPKLSQFIIKINKLFHRESNPIIWSRASFNTNLSGTKYCPNHISNYRAYNNDNKTYNHL